MRIHHLNCGCMCPVGGRLWDGASRGATARLVCHCLLIETDQGLALRTAFSGWYTVIGDVVSAWVGIYYWTMRRTYGSLMRGAKLFEDMKERQRQALEINDNIVQGLFVAQTALALDEREMSEEALRSTLDSARQIISDLLGGSGTQLDLGPGQLVREQPAVVAGGAVAHQ